MTAIVLALLSAAGYGASDFLAGWASRSTSYRRVAVLVQGVGALVVVAALPWVEGTSSAGALLWGGVSGLGAALGTMALYYGLAAGQMAVAGPISGVGAAALPVLIGLVLGERPSAITLVGIAVALPAVWLVARNKHDPVRTATARRGTGAGLLAGVGFGLLFVALAQAPSDSGLWPGAASVVVAALSVATVSLFDRAGRGPVTRIEPHVWASGIAAGVLGAAGPVLFLLASREGLLVVVAVLAALYPAVTVLLARSVLGERIARSQVYGLLLAAAAVVAIAGG